KEESVERRPGAAGAHASIFCRTNSARLPRVENVAASISSSATAVTQCSASAVMRETPAMESSSGMAPRSGVVASPAPSRPRSWSAESTTVVTSLITLFSLCTGVVAAHGVVGKAQPEAPIGAVPRREARDLVEVVAGARRAPGGGDRGGKAQLARKRGMLGMVVASRAAVRVGEQANRRAGDLLQPLPTRGHLVPRPAERDLGEDRMHDGMRADLHARSVEGAHLLRGHHEIRRNAAAGPPCDLQGGPTAALGLEGFQAGE